MSAAPEDFSSEDPTMLPRGDRDALSGIVVQEGEMGCPQEQSGLGLFKYYQSRSDDDTAEITPAKRYKLLRRAFLREKRSLSESFSRRCASVKHRSVKP